MSNMQSYEITGKSAMQNLNCFFDGEMDEIRSVLLLIYSELYNLNQ